MILTRRLLYFHEMGDVTAYGSSGNARFDRACLRFLYGTHKMLTHTRLLESIPEQEVDDSNYVKQPIGVVEIDQLRLVTSKIAFVTIRPGDVQGNSHAEGEWYRVSERHGPGIVQLGDETYELACGKFYFTPPGVLHALRPKEDDKLGILVYKFSPDIIDDFDRGHRLQLAVSESVDR